MFFLYSPSERGRELHRWFPFFVHFWCNFLGIEKAYKIETQLLVGFIQRREREAPGR
jgi:hypothetical protein